MATQDEGISASRDLIDHLITNEGKFKKKKTEVTNSRAKKKIDLSALEEESEEEEVDHDSSCEEEDEGVFNHSDNDNFEEGSDQELDRIDGINIPNTGKVFCGEIYQL